MQDHHQDKQVKISSAACKAVQLHNNHLCGANCNLRLKTKELWKISFLKMSSFENHKTAHLSGFKTKSKKPLLDKSATRELGRLHLHQWHQPITKMSQESWSLDAVRRHWRRWGNWAIVYHGQLGPSSSHVKRTSLLQEAETAELSQGSLPPVTNSILDIISRHIHNGKCTSNLQKACSSIPLHIFHSLSHIWSIFCSTLSVITVLFS